MLAEAYKDLAPAIRSQSIAHVMSSQTKPKFHTYFPRCKGQIP